MRAELQRLYALAGLTRWGICVAINGECGRGATVKCVITRDVRLLPASTDSTRGSKDITYWLGDEDSSLG